MELPAPRVKHRWFHFSWVYLYAISFYLFTNNQGYRVAEAAWEGARHIFTPHYLPLTFIDHFFPFWPWTGWIYITVYVLPIVPVMVVRTNRDLKLLLIGFLILATVCDLIFMFYPTFYPRPTIEGGGFFLDGPLKMMHLLDKPANCFPSLHVGYAFLSAFFVTKLKPRLGHWVLFWAILIAISTLTTKQHYIWDVLAGYGMARVLFASVMYFSSKPVLKKSKAKVA